MNKLALYIFEGNELEEVIIGLKKIKEYIDKYEDNTEGTIKKLGRDSKKTQSPPSGS